MYFGPRTTDHFGHCNVIKRVHLCVDVNFMSVPGVEPMQSDWRRRTRSEKEPNKASVFRFFPPSDAKISSSSDKTASTRLLFVARSCCLFFLSLVLGVAGSRFLLSSRTEKTLIGCPGQLIVPQIGAWQDGCARLQFSNTLSLNRTSMT